MQTDDKFEGFPTNPEMEEVWKFSSLHKKYLENSETCYCFYCLHEPFSPKLIKTWIDDGQTALCPFCGIDAIIPQAIKTKVVNYYSPEFRRRMYEYWFVDEEGKVYILKDGKIVGVPRNE